MADLSRRHLLLAVPLLAAAAPAAPADGHSFSFPSLEGGTIDLAQYRGKPVLVVNTASFCGFAPQFAKLQALHEYYASRGLLVVGVPSNDFNQEMDDDAAIKTFCEAEFGVDFPVAMRCHVKGAQAHPFFAWVASQGAEPRWNFFKYLISDNGRLLQVFPSKAEPDSPEVTRAIEAALAG
jgi:glutathione peroxidase